MYLLGVSPGTLVLTLVPSLPSMLSPIITPCALSGPPKLRAAFRFTWWAKAPSAHQIGLHPVDASPNTTSFVCGRSASVTHIHTDAALSPRTAELVPSQLFLMLYRCCSLTRKEQHFACVLFEFRLLDLKPAAALPCTPCLPLIHLMVFLDAAP